jgi:two-component system chemotaxis response regulator CheB
MGKKMNKNLNVLVVDDTIFYRKLLSDIIAGIPGVELAGVASNGMIAVKKIDLSPPDLVLMDVAMPEMDGLQALERIKKDHPETQVIMVSGVDVETASLTVKALGMGALDFIAKPRADSPEQAMEELKGSLTPLLTLARTMKSSSQTPVMIQDKKLEEKVQATQKDQGPLSVKAEPRARADSEKRAIPKIDLIALGVSTGGPNALKKIIPGLAKDLGVPILAVQHMPPVFTASLAESLDKISGIRVMEAKPEQTVEDGNMYIAPGGRHMVVRKRGASEVRIGLVDTPPVNNCRPAGDVLFRSIAMVYGPNVLAVILTGMGSDGLAGVTAIRRKGGYCLIQDERSSVVWGMPGSVAAAGEADEIVSEDRISRRIMEIVKGGA